MKIESHDRTIKDILGSGYYKIPRFQRPYSWERDNIDEFWQDTIIGNDSDYFIGSIVVYKSGSEFGIVDGQQRLTTITILLCAIRNAFDSNNFASLAQGLHQLIERPTIDSKNQYVVITETSHPYFQEYIQKYTPPDSSASFKAKAGEEERRIQEAFELVSGYVDEDIKQIKAQYGDDSPPEIETYLKRLRDNVLGLKLIFISLDQEDDAYSIFETLNTRGKDLAPSDLVKNHLAKFIKPTNNHIDVLKIKWTNIAQTVTSGEGNAEIETFLHHYCLSKYTFIPAKRLYKTLKKEISAATASAFLDDLEQEAERYKKILEPDAVTWTKEEREIRRTLDGLNTFRVKQPVPLVLAVLRCYQEKTLTLSQAKNILSSIERFHFVHTAVTSQRSSGGIAQMYASYARRINAATDKDAKQTVIVELITNLKTKIPDFEIFKASFPKIYYTSRYTRQKRLVQYILLKFFEYFNPSIPVDVKALTIEHICPEKPKAGQETLSPEIVGSLGNLVFITEADNVKLGNKRFKDKQRAFKELKHNLDEVLSSADQWGEDQIRQRLDFLSGVAYSKIWKL